MDLSREVDDYIKETIDHSLGLPISIDVLRKKLYMAEESHRRLHEQNLSLVSRLEEKDQVIDRVRFESSMNAQALKKFVAENQKLAGECNDLVSQCTEWEKECFLYHQDRESLMDFGNELDQRARVSESRVHELEEEVKKISNLIESEEDILLDSVLSSFFSETTLGRSFLESNIEDQSCRTLLTKWDKLKPTTQKVMSLVSLVKRCEKEKECLILNLAKAEEEVELVSIQNRELDRENRNLLKQFSNPNCSVEKVKSNKRKSSSIEKTIDLSSSGTI